MNGLISLRTNDQMTRMGLLKGRVCPTGRQQHRSGLGRIKLRQEALRPECPVIKNGCGSFPFAASASLQWFVCERYIFKKMSEFSVGLFPRNRCIHGSRRPPWETEALVEAAAPRAYIRSEIFVVLSERELVL